MLTNDTNNQMRQTMKGLGYAACVLLALSLPLQAGSYSSTRTTSPSRSGSMSRGTAPAAAPAKGNRVSNAPARTSSMPVNRPSGTATTSRSQSLGGSNSFTKASATSNGWNNGNGQGMRNGGSNVYVNKFGRGPEQSMIHEGRSHAGRIPENHYRSHFGREHAFRFNHHVAYGEHPSFRFGGVSFRALQPWPLAWRETDEVYIDTVGGAYFLCNRAFPGVRIAVDPGECDSCGQQQLVAANDGPVCDQCSANTQDGSNNTPTLYRGETCDQVLATMGNPNRIIELGTRTIYMYQDMRVTFRGGRVSDIR